MFGLFCFVLTVLVSPFKSKIRLEAKNVALRDQLIVLRCRAGSGSRTTIAYSWSSCVAGFPSSSKP